MGLQKNWLQKICKILGFKLKVMRGFHKGITIGGRASGSFHILNLNKWVAKNLQNFGIWVEIQVGGHERFPKRYNTWW